MPYKVEFSKVQNDHNRLRDDVIVGEAPFLPAVGKSFIIIGPPRDNPEATCRYVRTNTITLMEVDDRKKGEYKFSTASGSIYSVKILEHIPGASDYLRAAKREMKRRGV